MGAAELAHGVVERLGLLKVADVPAGVRVDENQGRFEPGMVAARLQYDSAAPGDAGNVRRPSANASISAARQLA